jgi:hypothetical protein
MGEPFASAWDLVEDVRLMPSRMGADSALRGAAALVLSCFLTRFDHTRDDSLPNGVSIEAYP